MKKYDVTIQFTWASTHNREVAWQEAESYIRRNMRGLATVLKVTNELPDKQAKETIAINEPIFSS